MRSASATCGCAVSYPRHVLAWLLAQSTPPRCPAPGASKCCYTGMPPRSCGSGTASCLLCKHALQPSPLYTHILQALQQFEEYEPIILLCSTAERYTGAAHQPMLCICICNNLATHMGLSSPLPAAYSTHSVCLACSMHHHMLGSICIYRQHLHA